MQVIQILQAASDEFLQQDGCGLAGALGQFLQMLFCFFIEFDRNGHVVLPYSSPIL